MFSIFKFLKGECQHVFNYVMDMTPRNKRGNIACSCKLCGKVFMAECGLDLPGTLVQN